MYDLQNHVGSNQDWNLKMELRTRNPELHSRLETQNHIQDQMLKTKFYTTRLKTTIHTQNLKMRFQTQNSNAHSKKSNTQSKVETMLTCSSSQSSTLIYLSWWRHCCAFNIAREMNRELNTKRPFYLPVAKFTHIHITYHQPSSAPRAGKFLSNFWLQ